MTDLPAPKNDPPPVPRLWLPIALVLLPLAISLAAATQVSVTVVAWAIALAGFLLSLLAAHGSIRWQDLSWKQLGWRAPDRWRDLLILVPLSVVGLIVITALGAAGLDAGLGWQPDLSQFDVLRGNVPALAGGLIVVWTVAAFGEELLWRGYLLNSLHRAIHGAAADHWPSWIVPLALSSVICGLAHAYQGPAGVVLTGIIGLGFGLSYFAGRRNLWACILTHGVYDTVGFVSVFLELAPA